LAHCLEIRCSVQGISAAKKESDEVAGYVSTCNVEPAGEMIEDN